jgi:hypothetical protein
VSDKGSSIVLLDDDDECKGKENILNEKKDDVNSSQLTAISKVRQLSMSTWRYFTLCH